MDANPGDSSTADGDAERLPPGHRLEHDAMGPVPVPATALYGAQTARAARWSFTNLRLPLPVVHALGSIKAAAARAHADANRLPAEMARAIERAAEEVAAGEHDDQFVVDLFQTGSGTSSHMNANEVVANRASELLGKGRGSKAVHPNDHVNLGQSSNDVMPSAVQLAVLAAGERRLLPALGLLVQLLHELAAAHWTDLRLGRTHLMAALPVRFGQQFRGYAWRLDAAATRIGAAIDACRELPLGGTAVGTGVNAAAGFAAATCAGIARATGLRVRETDRHLAGQAGLDRLAAVAADTGLAATALYQIVNDIRWQGAALGELELPALQPGSSMMPGKVNPVVCEAVLMACAQIIGNAAVTAFANTQGQFELNTMLPVTAHNVLQSIDLMAGAASVLRTECLRDLRVAGGVAAQVQQAPTLATLLVPVIGHDRAAAIAARAAATRQPVADVARESTDLPANQIDALLDPDRLCGETGRQA